MLASLRHPATLGPATATGEVHRGTWTRDAISDLLGKVRQCLGTAWMGWFYASFQVIILLIAGRDMLLPYAEL